MRKKRRSKSEITLPEAIIHKIQSLLSGKEAARTTILSKSWHSAWLTRPTIDLDDRDIAPSDAFERFSSKTIQRYRDARLNIESFRLRRNCRYHKAHTNNLIVSAMQIGATNVELEIPHSISLPQELFASQTLVRLSLTDCSLDGYFVILCSRLEELSLTRCNGSALASLYEFHFQKLRCLFLHSVNVERLVSSDFTSRFPCLKDLGIRSCPGSERIKISSTSLQTISFKPIKGLWRAKFVVPNIRAFNLSVSTLPSHLSVKASSREWEFDISISCNRFHKSSWFLKLKEYLKKFRLSIITLLIHIPYGWLPDESFYTEVEGKPLAVKTLMIDAQPSFYSAMLLRLFGVFRPEFIYHSWLTDKSPGWFSNNEALDILCMRLMNVSITPTCGIPNQNMFGRFNLEKVNVQVYEKLDTEASLVLKKRLDASKAPVNDCTVRFELIWGD